MISLFFNLLQTMNNGRTIISFLFFLFLFQYHPWLIRIVTAIFLNESSEIDSEYNFNPTTAAIGQLLVNNSTHK